MRLQYSYEQQAKQKSRFVRRQRCIDNLAMKIDKLSNIPQQTNCKKGFQRYQNRCYRYVSTNVTFFEAEMFCRTQQSSLADIGSAKEDQWIKH